MYIRDTIAAIATPLGSGGIGIIRVSGPEAEHIGTLVFSAHQQLKGGGFESHRLLYGRFVDPVSRALIDEGMCVLMRSPRSYTREDVLELHCHGGYLVVRALLHACISAGARLAAPGEFTKRAFLNGRLDLAQAESVMDVIASRTERSLALAQSQREGTLSRELAAVRTRLVESLALVEAYIDFPDDEVDPAVFHQVEQQVESAAARLVQLVDSYRTGRVLREGVSVLLLGRPNAGKSSLLNALSGSERAIVSDLPGTTRDLIEEGISLDGLPVKIIDAAGIRAHHADCVEREGVRRALDKLSVADLALFVVDGSVPLNPDDRSVVASIAAVPYFIVVTKSDLPQLADVSEFTGASGMVMISTKNGTGIDQLARMLYDYFVVLPDPTSDDHAVLSNVRHRDVLMRAVQSLYQFLANSKAGLPVEFLSLDLRGGLSALGEVTGETSADEVLDLIFSSFCIGK